MVSLQASNKSLTNIEQVWVPRCYNFVQGFTNDTLAFTLVHLLEQSSCKCSENQKPFLLSKTVKTVFSSVTSNIRYFAITLMAVPSGAIVLASSPFAAKDGKQ